MAGSYDIDAFGTSVWPTLAQLDELFDAWATRYDDILVRRKIGISLEGRNIWAFEITDRSVADAEKERVLITALHAGVERSGTTTIGLLMEWLLGEGEEEKEVRRRQHIVCVPIPDPDNYVAGRHGPVYAHWTPEGPAEPDRMPEGMAIQALMDELQPEVHADIHGLSLAFENYVMLENSGASYSNLALRPYYRDIVERMDRAALNLGFGSARPAEDGEMLFWGPDLDHMAHQLWRGRPRFYAATYAYHHYHTMPVVSEVCWESSGLARHRALLLVGNETFPGESEPGYPVRVAAGCEYHLMTAYGKTAAERRRSRVELWQKRRQLVYGMIDPNAEGRVTFVCATTAEAAERWLKPRDLGAWLANLEDHPKVNVPELDTFFQGWPAGQNAPTPVLNLNGMPAQGSEPIRHGFNIRLRIFDPSASMGRIVINGRTLVQDEDITIWHARGMTYFQIEIPPGRSATEDLFIVTCEYTTDTVRARWHVTEALERAGGGSDR